MRETRTTAMKNSNASKNRSSAKKRLPKARVNKRKEAADKSKVSSSTVHESPTIGTRDRVSTRSTPSNQSQHNLTLDHNWNKDETQQSTTSKSSAAGTSDLAQKFQLKRCSVRLNREGASDSIYDFDADSTDMDVQNSDSDKELIEKLLKEKKIKLVKKKAKTTKGGVRKGKTKDDLRRRVLKRETKKILDKTNEIVESASAAVDDNLADNLGDDFNMAHQAAISPTICNEPAKSKGAYAALPSNEAVVISDISDDISVPILAENHQPSSGMNIFAPKTSSTPLAPTENAKKRKTTLPAPSTLDTANIPTVGRRNGNVPLRPKAIRFSEMYTSSPPKTFVNHCSILSDMPDISNNVESFIDLQDENKENNDVSPRKAYIQRTSYRSPLKNTVSR